LLRLDPLHSRTRTRRRPWGERKKAIGTSVPSSRASGDFMR